MQDHVNTLANSIRRISFLRNDTFVVVSATELEDDTRHVRETHY